MRWLDHPCPEYLSPAERKDLARRMLEFMRYIHAKPNLKPKFAPRTRDVERVYEFELHTPVGRMLVAFADPCLRMHCRFLDGQRAHAVLGCPVEIDQATGQRYAQYFMPVLYPCTAKQAMTNIFVPCIGMAWRWSGVPVPW